MLWGAVSSIPPMYCYSCKSSKLYVNATTQGTGNPCTEKVQLSVPLASRTVRLCGKCADAGRFYCGPGQQKIRALCRQLACSLQGVYNWVESPALGTLSSQRSRQESISVAAANGPTRSALCCGPSRWTLEEKGGKKLLLLVGA